MPIIHQLPSHIANLIAAGEVVERPASVVKELLENAFDAGARHVTVELQNGGMTLLRVQDDGCGMAPDDAETAFLRHATSKIRSREDLEAIGTLGFRGEALAATAAVSRIDLLTRTPQAEEGVHLTLEAGAVVTREPAGCPVGTTILVRDLFYNTPARMKFMKSDTAEAGAVLAAVQKQALAHPECAIRLLSDGEEKLRTPGDGELRSAIYTVLGRQTALELTEVDSRWEKLALSGFVTRPTATRGNRSYEIFFVNGRFVKSRLMSAALEEAYRNQIAVGRFPACVLNLTMPLGAVDVNVHPAKTEVKFLNEREIFDCVHYGVLAALNRQSGRVEMEFGEKRRGRSEERGEWKADSGKWKVESDRRSSGQAVGVGDLDDPPGKQPSMPGQLSPTVILSERSESKDLFPSEERGKWKVESDRRFSGQAVGVGDLDDPPGKQPSMRGKPPAFRTMDVESYKAFLATLGEGPSAAPSEAMRQQIFSQSRPTLRSDVQIPAGPSADPETKEEAPEQTELPLETAPWRVVGEVLDTYIIVEQNDAVLLIDKHAAHERINFERLKAEGVQVTGQLLLAPLTLELDPVDAASLTKEQPLLQSLGYDFDDLGGGTLLLRQIPADLPEADAAASLTELAEHLQQGRRDSAETLRERLLHSIACKAAIKGGWHTAEAERDELVRQVLTRDDLKYCPHGRPIVVVLTKKQLEKQFRRQ